MSGNYADNMTGFFGFAGVRDAAPVNVDLPYCEQVDKPGSEAEVDKKQYLGCTTGNWTGDPTSYAYQWMRDGTTNIGTDAASYTVTDADAGHAISCIVTATNAVGSTDAPPSNAVAVPAAARASPPPPPEPPPPKR